MATASALEPAAPAGASDTAFFGHPRGLSTLFFTELWERFSYYGMRALLILFMTAPIAAGGLAFDVAKAGLIYGTYTSLVYLTALPGGWLADRILGQRRATLYGGILIMCGHISLAFPSLATFYLGLGLVILGTGLLKPNISAMVGQLYSEEDARRDAGFSIYYMGINLGAFLAPFACGWLAQSEQFKGVLASAGLRAEASWHWGFAMAAVGMFFGLIQYLRGWKHLGAAGLEPVGVKDATERRKVYRQLWSGLGVIAGLVIALAILQSSGAIRISSETIGKAFGYVLTFSTVAFFIWMFTMGQWTRAERKRLLVVLVLFVAAAVFWSVFEQAGSTLNLFADRNTRKEIFGIPLAAAYFQSLNSLFIILLAPVFAWLWVRLGKHDPSSPTKFTLGLVFAALGFGVMFVAAQRAQQGIQVSPLWLVVTYLLHTIGELCLSPVGLSAMTKLAPARIAGLTMGIWFLAVSVGDYIAGLVAGGYESLSLPTIFGSVTLYALGAAVVLALLVRPVKRMLARP